MSTPTNRTEQCLQGLKANWYWLVLPTFVAAAWWAWKKYCAQRRITPKQPAETL